MSDNGEAIYYISRGEFIRRMKEMNDDWDKLAERYDMLATAPEMKYKEWYKQQEKELKDDIKHNNEMIFRANVEAGYNLFWVDGEGNLKMRRCSRKEFQEIYKPKSSRYVI
jgi:hypothetical protein